MVTVERVSSIKKAIIKSAMSKKYDPCKTLFGSDVKVLEAKVETTSSTNI